MGSDDDEDTTMVAVEPIESDEEPEEEAAQEPSATYLGKGKPSTFLGCEPEGSLRSLKVCEPPPQELGLLRRVAHGFLGALSTPQRVGLVLGVLLAVIFSQVEISDDSPKANDALAVTALVVSWWVFEVTPIAITSLLPLVLFPLVEVQTGKVIAATYYNFISFLFIGAFLVVVAVQKVNAHKRFALKALQLFGTEPRWILLGFMVVSGVMSMFASNTSTTLLLLPLVSGLLEGREKTPDSERFHKAALLGVAYGASSGGVGSLTGSAPQLLVSSIVATRFPDAPAITFGSWMGFALPIALLLIVASWGVIYMVHLRGVKVALNKETLNDELKALGPLSQDEKSVSAVLVLMVVLWLIRPYALTPFIGTCTADGVNNEADCDDVGAKWTGFVDDGTVACLSAFLLFVIPSAANPGRMILDEDALNHLPWGILLLFGAGFAIAEAFSVSGLSAEIGGALSGLGDLNPVALVFIITTLVCYLTELTSNTATASIFTPILLEVGVQNQLNPLLLVLPATVATSLAYMLPISTPPNAIVFGTGKISFWDMIRTGFFINPIGIVVTVAFTFITGPTLAGDLNSFPDWANVTAIIPPP